MNNTNWVQDSINNLDYTSISGFLGLFNIINELVYQVNYWHNVADIRSTWHPYCSSGSGVITEVQIIDNTPEMTSSVCVALVQDNWNSECSSDNNWCNQADRTQNGIVDGGDLNLCLTM
jgi:hypothetical protein